MSLSRGLSALRQARRACKPISASVQQVRHSGGLYSYRCGPYPHTKVQVYAAQGVSAFMWAWIIYHCITQYEHITGEFFPPDPKSWTDEELGIPPDDVD